MFKYIVVFSVLAVVAMSQPITNDIDDDNRSSATSTPITNVGNENANDDLITVGQASDAASQFDTQIDNTISNIDSDAASVVNQFGQQADDNSSQIGSQIQQQYESKKASLGQIIDRLSEAARLTFIEEKESIDKALQSIKIASGHTFQAGWDTLGTGFDMILILPKFAINALGIEKPTNATQ